jgi:hypothetical protein
MMISRRSISVSTDGDQPTPAKPASAHGGRGVTAAPEVVVLEVPVRIRPTALRWKIRPASRAMMTFQRSTSMFDLALSGRRRQSRHRRPGRRSNAV